MNESEAVGEAAARITHRFSPDDGFQIHLAGYTGKANS
jgi:hypothetical protein